MTFLIVQITLTTTERLSLDLVDMVEPLNSSVVIYDASFTQGTLQRKEESTKRLWSATTTCSRGAI